MVPSKRLGVLQQTRSINATADEPRRQANHIHNRWRSVSWIIDIIHETWPWSSENRSGDVRPGPLVAVRLLNPNTIRRGWPGRLVPVPADG